MPRMNSIHKTKGMELLSEISYLFRLEVITKEERNYMSGLLKNSMSFESLAYYGVLKSFVSRIQERYTQTQAQKYTAINDFAQKINEIMEELKND